jgi:hypothetical protein
MKYKEETDETSWSAEWVGVQHPALSCCWYHIAAYRDKESPLPWMSEVRIGAFGGILEYYGTWRFRLKAAWRALRGELDGHSVALEDRESATEFLKDLTEAIEGTFPGVTK